MRPGARTDFGPPPRFITSEPRLGFGAWAVGGEGWGTPADERDRTAAVERAVERGIDFFDTAPTYGDGASETLLGRALRPYREQVTIATKVGPYHEPRRSLEASLRRLACDQVDLVQLHETLDGWEWRLEKLHALQEEGKTVAIGLCNATRRQLAHALEIAPVVTCQAPYNLFDRDVEQRELPLCRQRGLGFLAYRPLASGLLTGKYAMVAIVLAGARDARQVDENAAAHARRLTPQEVAAIDEIVAEVFRPARATERAHALAASWGIRERFIVERLDGATTYEAIAAVWTDTGERPMIAAQVKVFVDQLREQELVEAES
ncbi:MAG: aldo/keto reductase [Gemmatimonadales bacterium]